LTLGRRAFLFHVRKYKAPNIPRWDIQGKFSISTRIPREFHTPRFLEGKKAQNFTVSFRKFIIKSAHFIEKPLKNKKRRNIRKDIPSWSEC